MFRYMHAPSGTIRHQIIYKPPVTDTLLGLRHRFWPSVLDSEFHDDLSQKDARQEWTYIIRKFSHKMIASRVCRHIGHSKFVAWNILSDFWNSESPEFIVSSLDCPLRATLSLKIPAGRPNLGIAKEWQRLLSMQDMLCIALHNRSLHLLKKDIALKSKHRTGKLTPGHNRYNSTTLQAELVTGALCAKCYWPLTSSLPGTTSPKGPILLSFMAITSTTVLLDTTSLSPDTVSMSSTVPCQLYADA